jgi:hypothetical protein
VTAQSTDAETVVRDCFAEGIAFAIVIQHRQLAVSISGVVPGGKFHRGDAVRL